MPGAGFCADVNWNIFIDELLVGAKQRLHPHTYLDASQCNRTYLSASYSHL